MTPNITDRVQESINHLNMLLDMNILICFLKEDEIERLQFCLDTLNEVKEILE